MRSVHRLGDWRLIGRCSVRSRAIGSGCCDGSRWVSLVGRSSVGARPLHFSSRGKPTRRHARDEFAFLSFSRVFESQPRAAQNSEEAVQTGNNRQYKTLYTQRRKRNGGRNLNSPFSPQALDPASLKVFNFSPAPHSLNTLGDPPRKTNKQTESASKFGVTYWLSSDLGHVHGSSLADGCFNGAGVG